MDKLEIRCKKCNKLLAKIGKNGMCKNIYLYCPRCKQEYEYTYKDELNENIELYESQSK